MNSDIISQHARNVVLKESKLIGEEVSKYFDSIGVPESDIPSYIEGKFYLFKGSTCDILRTKSRIFCLGEQELFRFTTKSYEDSGDFTFSVERFY